MSGRHLNDPCASGTHPGSLLHGLTEGVAGVSQRKGGRPAPDAKEVCEWSRTTAD